MNVTPEDRVLSKSCRSRGLMTKNWKFVGDLVIFSRQKIIGQFGGQQSCDAQRSLPFVEHDARGGIPSRLAGLPT